MSQTLLIMGGLLTVCSTRITCPSCSASSDVATVLETTPQPKLGYWKRKCRGCGLLLGFTTDIKGDAYCWDYAAGLAERKRLDALPQPTEEEIEAFLAGCPPCDPEAEGRKLLERLEREYSHRKRV